MKIGILGGTFDPIHQAHLAMAQAAMRQFGLEKVLFVPAFIPPHKKEKRDMTPAPYRYRMVEAAVADHPGFEVSDVEFLRPEISYTVDTLRTFRLKHPQVEIFLLIGADTAREIPTWKDAGELARMTTFLAAPRPGYALEKPVGFEVLSIDMPPVDLSSTRLREDLKNGREPGPDALPPRVADYIRRMKLYQEKSCSSS